ncbi:Ca2+:Cation antiporter family [Micromonas pusilla CCMP1545]|uniref:Ca2+:Cation antiporter family n=1 Tax=Micromonas pusilla (strain CCMP1545) TaxID=564608 RepID=C1N1H0_MICPC|nr:Ca2+:Cation antiporter family [Micromonas pusilla CCMP1545]EEH54446.1 Ca2+:Cation antiporter family [Micromonas pusilla CCMP1545]|eukprot:XP_003061816.1 Ca2+:Cation antiporter family [Micromonas pusilla CCMP1545]
MLPSMIRRVRAARAKLSYKDKLRQRQGLMLLAAAVSCVSTYYYGGGSKSFFGRKDWTPSFDFASDGERASLSAITGLGSSSTTARRLLSSSTCSTEDWEDNGGVVLYFIGMFYMFLGIAIVCDDFFVPALEVICEVLDLSDDVAGATFMAAGSSAPELASSTMSLINPNAGSEIGVGTIVGSAIFNILIIIGATVMATGAALQLDWKPVTRDCFFYAAAIAGIVGTFAGGVVNWWEGGIYVCFYGTYIVTMKYNKHLMKWMDKVGGKWMQPEKEFKQISMKEKKAAALAEKAQSSKEPSSHGPGAVVESTDGAAPPKTSIADVVLDLIKQQRKENAEKWRKKIAIVKQDDGTDVTVTPYMSPGHIRAYRKEMKKVAAMLEAKKKKDVREALNLEEGKDKDDGDEEDDAPWWKVPEEKKDWPLWFLSFPWYACFAGTIPPCGEEKYRKYYIMSFFMSIGWIGFITHWMIEWCVVIGCVLNIPNVVMGTTVLAAGTSIPDALSSISVAKDGLADMAVANAVGSNVFDIWLGLGLPWLLYLSWQNKNYIEVNTNELVPSSLILAGVLVLYYSAIFFNKFKLEIWHGKVFFVIYGFYVAYSIILVWILDVYDLDD